MKREEMYYWLDYIKKEVPFVESPDSILNHLRELQNGHTVFVIARTLCSEYIEDKKKESLSIFEDFMENYLIDMKKENQDKNLISYKEAIALYEMSKLYTELNKDYAKGIEYVDRCIDLMDNENLTFLDFDINRDRVLEQREMINTYVDNV